jgi:hypothetical protein
MLDEGRLSTKENIMQELNKAIEEEIKRIPEECFEEKHALRICAEKWSIFSLNTFDGDLLSKALQISRSLSDFVNELEKG